MWKSIKEAPLNQSLLIRRIIYHTTNEYAYNVGWFQDVDSLELRVGLTSRVCLAEHNEFIVIADLDSLPRIAMNKPHLDNGPSSVTSDESIYGTQIHDVVEQYDPELADELDSEGHCHNREMLEIIRKGLFQVNAESEE